MQTEKKERAKADLTAKIEDLELTIKQLTEAIDTLKSEVAEMQVQLKRAGVQQHAEYLPGYILGTANSWRFPMVRCKLMGA